MAGKFDGRSPRRRARPAFPKGAIIRTILRDLPPEALARGRRCSTSTCRCAIRSAPTTHFTDDVALMIEEAKLREGRRHRGDRRRRPRRHEPQRRRAQAHLDGIGPARSSPAAATTCSAPIPPTLPRSPRIRSPRSLPKEAAASRFGAFGEIGQQGGVMTDDERKVFTGDREGARAHRPADLHAQRLHRHAADAESGAERHRDQAARSAAWPTA